MTVVWEAETITQELLGFVTWVQQAIQYPADAALGWDACVGRDYRDDLLSYINEVAGKLERKAEQELGYESRVFPPIKEAYPDA